MLRVVLQSQSKSQQRQWFGTRGRPPRRGGNRNNKKAVSFPPEAQYFEIDEDEDDGEQWKKIFGEEGDEWEDVPFDDELEEDDGDNEDDGDEMVNNRDAATREAVKKLLSSQRTETSSGARRQTKRKTPSSKREAYDEEPVRQHSLNPRLASVISAGWVSLNTTAKYIMGKTQSAPLLKGDEHYVKGRPSNEQLSMAYQMHQMLQDYLQDLVDKRYDSTFCLPGTLDSIEIRAVETSPDLHLARVYWSLPSDCLQDLPESLQVKLIYHIEDVVFEQEQGRRKLQRVIHSQLGYLRNPPKISMVWWDDEDDFDYEFDDDDEERKDDEDDGEGHQERETKDRHNTSVDGKTLESIQ